MPDNDKVNESLAKGPRPLASMFTLGSDETAVFLVTKIAVFAPYGGPAHCGSQLIHGVAVGFRRG